MMDRAYRVMHILVDVCGEFADEENAYAARVKVAQNPEKYYLGYAKGQAHVYGQVAKWIVNALHDDARIEDEERTRTLFSDAQRKINQVLASAFAGDDRCV